MKQKEEFFLPMVHEAVDRFLRHLTVDVAKPIFDLLQYRRKNGLTQEDIMKHFDQVVIEEQTYQYYLSRMRMEINQLFELTPPYLHRKLRVQLNSLQVTLESAIERKSIISQLKASNRFFLQKMYRPDGNFELYSFPRNKPVLDLALLSSSYFDEYVAILNSMLFHFKDCISVFDEKRSSKKTDQDENLPPISEYLAPPLKAFMINWEKFLDTCHKYSLANLKWKDYNKPVVKCFSKDDGKYLWEGTIPMLGEFITTLADKEVQILRPGVTKKELAILFLKFFGLENKFKNPHFLLINIEPKTPPKQFFFSSMKPVKPSTH